MRQEWRNAIRGAVLLPDMALLAEEVHPVLEVLEAALSGVVALEEDGKKLFTTAFFLHQPDEAPQA